MSFPLKLTYGVRAMDFGLKIEREVEGQPGPANYVWYSRTIHF